MAKSEKKPLVTALPEGTIPQWMIDAAIMGSKGKNRNAKCWCGSGRKFKHCCLSRDATTTN